MDYRENGQTSTPEHSGSLVRHRHERIGGVMPRRCQRGIGESGNVQILGEIPRQDFASKNIFQQFFVARTQNNSVVAQFFRGGRRA